MSRYIDVDALGIGKANREIFNNKAYADGWNAAIDIIVSAPTADVQEVKHGKWIVKEKDIFCYCSCCGCKSGALFNYCPHCGAKFGGIR